MKQVSLIFVIPDEDENGLDHEIRHSPLLSEWPVWGWIVEDATEAQVEWFEHEYGEEWKEVANGSNL